MNHLQIEQTFVETVLDEIAFVRESFNGPVAQWLCSEAIFLELLVLVEPVLQDIRPLVPSVFFFEISQSMPTASAEDPCQLDGF